MAGQLARHYSSPERPIRGDVEPPAPGQAYFGYPQPSQTSFPVPPQTTQSAAPGVAERSALAPPKARPASSRPYRAHGRHHPSRVWLHLIGYPLAALLGLLAGAAAMRAADTSADHRAAIEHPASAGHPAYTEPRIRLDHRTPPSSTQRPRP